MLGTRWTISGLGQVLFPTKLPGEVCVVLPIRPPFFGGEAKPQEGITLPQSYVGDVCELLLTPG